jgi:DNA-binding NarL/FixJ family response regulator
MRVLIADDQAEVRSALRLLLEQQEDVRVVGGTSGTDGLVDLTEALCPDVLLIDWELPGLESVVSTLNRKRRLLDDLRHFCPGTRVVAMSGRPEARSNALRAGAHGFVSKGDPADALLEALAAVGGV